MTNRIAQSFINVFAGGATSRPAVASPPAQRHLDERAISARVNTLISLPGANVATIRVRDGVPGRLTVARKCVAWTALDALEADCSGSLERKSGLVELRFRIPVHDLVSVRIVRLVLSAPIVLFLSRQGALPPILLRQGGVHELLEALQEIIVLKAAPHEREVFHVHQFGEEDVSDPLSRSLSTFSLRRKTITLVESPLSFGNAIDTSPKRDELTELVQEGHVPPDYIVEHAMLEEVVAHRDYVEKRRLEREGRQTRLLDTELGEFEDLRSSEDVIDEPDDDELLVRTGPRIAKPLRARSTSRALDKRQVARTKLPPLSYSDLVALVDQRDGTYSKSADMTIRRTVFYAGVAEDDLDARRAVWRFLLLGCTPSNNASRIAERKESYETVMAQWKSISDEQASMFAPFRDRRNRVAKDVVRTDRTLPFYRGNNEHGDGPSPNVDRLQDILITYSMYNFDCGYVQGMNDLLSPILYLLDDDADAFACFVSLMRDRAQFFSRDQVGMTLQLEMFGQALTILDPEFAAYLHKIDAMNAFFAYRWFLTLFKREFTFDDTMRLWEVLWSDYLHRFEIFVGLAIIMPERDIIFSQQFQFDDLLRHVVALSQTLDLEVVLNDAERLYINFHRHLAVDGSNVSGTVLDYF